MLSRLVTRAASASALVLIAAATQAATLIGLTADNKLVKIDTGTMAASAPMSINGADKVVGIDVRPADGKLWGLTSTGRLLTIDPANGKATLGAMLKEKVALGERPVVDFNPVADRLRVIATGGVSLRINVETGDTVVDKPLNFDAADASKDKKPMVVAGGYTNSSKGSKATELFHVDAGTGTLVLQSPPNDGVLKTRGALGVTGLADAVLDIDNESEGKNTVWMVSGGWLFTIDIANGKATKVGQIKGLTGKLVDIAVWK
jgi:hypothetical protein